MITMTLLHFVAVIAFTLLDGYYLGRTAFACYPVRRVLTYFASGTTRSMHDRLHRLAGIFPVLGVAQLNIRQCSGSVTGSPPTLRAECGRNQLPPEATRAAA